MCAVLCCGQVHIHEPASKKEVHIFVLFEAPGDAVKARAGLDQRFFGGRVVSAEYFPVHKFHAQDFSS